MFKVNCFLKEDFIFKPKLINHMFLDRAEQFKRRMGWDVHLDEKGWEKDQYDKQDPLYVIVEGPNQSHLGSGRFMSCHKPTMTEEFFSFLLPKNWKFLKDQSLETTRFCISPTAPKKHSKYSGSLIMVGGLNCCLAEGFHDVIGVYYENYSRLYKRMGWVPDAINSKNDLVLGHWSVSKRVYLDICDRLPEFKIEVSERAKNKLKEWSSK